MKLRRSPFLGFALVTASAAVAQQAPPPSPVAVDAVTVVNVAATTPVTGTVYSRNEMQITAGVDGTLVEVAEPGSRVPAGSVVARIDTAPLALQRAEQQAAAERARAQLRFLDAQLERQKNLRHAQSLSANDLEETQSNRDVAASDLQIAHYRIKQLDDQIARAEVRAPFDGVVVERLRREGETVARGTTIGRLTDPGTLEIRALVPLRYAGRVAEGQALQLYGFESSHEGFVRAVIPPVDVRTQAFELRIDLPADAPRIWSVGQLVTVSVPLASEREALTVDRDALILRQDGTFVFRVDGENRAHRVTVSTGESFGERIAVSGELSDGDMVAVRGAETLADGSPVTVLNPMALAGADRSEAVAQETARR